MDKALNGIAALNEGFRCIIDDHLREYQRAQDAEQDSRLQQLEDRVLELLRGQLARQLGDVRRELWDHVDERQQVTKTLQEESEQALMHSFQDRAAQLHKQWTLEQEAASTGLRRQGEELRTELTVHVAQELDRLSQRLLQRHRQEVDARFIEDREQRELQLSQIRAELQDVRITMSTSAAHVSSFAPVAAAGVPAAAAPAAVAPNPLPASAASPEEETGSLAAAGECPAVAVDGARAATSAGACAAASAPVPPLCPSDATGVPLVAQTGSVASGAEASGVEQAAEVGQKGTELVIAEDTPQTLGSAISAEESLEIETSLTQEGIDDLDSVLSSPHQLRSHGDPADAEARGKQRPPLLGTRGRVIVVLGIFSIMAFLCTFLFVKPFITLYIVAVSLVWIIFLLGEEPMIRMVNSKANSSQYDFCKRKLVLFAACLKRVQNCRSSHDKEQQSMVLLYSLSVLGISWNPDATNMIGYLLATFNPALIFPILGLQFLLCCWLARKLVSYLHSPTLRRPLHGNVDHPAVSAEATKKLEIIQENLKVTPGSRRHRQAEAKIREIFQDCDQEMLNELLAEMSHSNACSLGDVILFFQDQEGQQARSEFLNLLCEERSSDLSVRSKSVVLDALMLMKLSSCEYGESAVGSLLQSALGDELSELKSIQDAGNVHSIHKLVFQDVTNREIRDGIVDHFLHEGMKQVAHRTLMANSHFCKLLRDGKRRNITPDSLNFLFEGEPYYQGSAAGHKWLKIFTDIDDTLECSGGRWPAGIDTRYPKHLPYPGATAFYRLLQGGGGVGQLVALSARPHLVGSVMEESVIRKFDKLRAQHGLHCMPALLTGAIDAGTTFLMSGGADEGMAALGQKKIEKIVEYIRLYPEFRIVFVGDNGQADFAVGLRIWEKYPQHVEQVWIHEVQQRDSTYRYEAESIEKAPINFFEDFVDAASQAATRRNPLLSPDGLLEVVRAAVSDFRKIQNWPSEEGRLKEADRLTKSIEAARAVLQGMGITEEVDPLIDEPPSPKAKPLDEKAENARSWWRRDATKQERKRTSKTPIPGTSSPPGSPFSSPRQPQPEAGDKAVQSLPELPAAHISEGAEEQPETGGEAGAAAGEAAAAPVTATAVDSAEMDSSGQPGSSRTQVLQWFRSKPQNNEQASETEAAVTMEPGQAPSAGYKSDAESSDAAEGGQTDSDKDRTSYFSRAIELARSAAASKMNNPSTVPEVDPLPGESSVVREETAVEIPGVQQPEQLLTECSFCSVPEGLAELAQEVAQPQDQLASAAPSSAPMSGMPVVGVDSANGLTAAAALAGTATDPTGTPATNAAKAGLLGMARRAFRKTSATGEIALKASNVEDADSRKTSGATSVTSAAEGQELPEEPKGRLDDVVASDMLTESPSSEPVRPATPGVSPQMLPASVSASSSLKDNFPALPPSRFDAPSGETLSRTNSEPGTGPTDAPNSTDASDKDSSAKTTPVLPVIEAEAIDSLEVPANNASDPAGSSAASDGTSAKRSIISRTLDKAMAVINPSTASPGETSVINSPPASPGSSPQPVCDPPGSGSDEALEAAAVVSVGKVRKRTQDLQRQIAEKEQQKARQKAEKEEQNAKEEEICRQPQEAVSTEPPLQASALAAADTSTPVAAADGASGASESSPPRPRSKGKRSFLSMARGAIIKASAKQGGPEGSSSEECLAAEALASEDVVSSAAEVLAVEGPAAEGLAAENAVEEVQQGSGEPHVGAIGTRAKCSSFLSLTSLQEGSEETEEPEDQETREEENQVDQREEEAEAQPAEGSPTPGQDQQAEEDETSAEAVPQGVAPAGSEPSEPQASEIES